MLWFCLGLTDFRAWCFGVLVCLGVTGLWGFELVVSECSLLAEVGGFGLGLRGLEGCRGCLQVQGLAGYLWSS